MSVKYLTGIFKEIPTYHSITSEQLELIHAVSRDIADRFWKSFIRKYGEPLSKRNVPDVVGDLGKMMYDLPLVEVYASRHVYLIRNADDGKRIVEHGEGSGGEAFQGGVGMSIQAVRKGQYVYFSYDAYGNFIPEGTLPTRQLFEAGIPISPVELLARDESAREEIINIRRRTRLGDEMQSSGDMYIALKLPEPDSQGNVVKVKKVLN